MLLIFKISQVVLILMYNGYLFIATFDLEGTVAKQNVKFRGRHRGPKPSHAG